MARVLQRTAAQRMHVLGQHQSATRQPGWTLRSIWFRLGLGVGFVFVLTGSHSISYSDLELAILYSSRWLELVIILLPRSPECWD